MGIFDSPIRLIFTAWLVGFFGGLGMLCARICLVGLAEWWDRPDEEDDER